MTENKEYPLISVLTPTWNRGSYLDRVWNGLNSQTYKNIEWLVCDDGSTDNTSDKLHELANRSSFPVVIITASVHIGKARMDNEAIARARGEFILWNDSDDYLLPQAIEKLVASWNSIPVELEPEYVGIAALCASQWGITSSPLPKEGTFDTSWNELAETFKVTGDMVAFTKAIALKNNPFPQIDFVIPEGVVWTALGEMKIRVHPEVLKIVEYQAMHCISLSGKMEYCRGRAYALAISFRILRSYPRSLRVQLWKLITYLRYSLHGEVGIRRTFRQWGTNSSLITMLLMLPAAYLLVLKDEMQRKVRKTHRDYQLAESMVTIDEYKVNCEAR